MQPLNCYLLRRNERAILIDTGVASHREAVLGQLWDRLPLDEPLSVFLTRPEPECAGNLGAIHRSKPIEEIVAVAVNPFDAYEEGVEGAVRINKLPSSVVNTVYFGDPPLLRVVPTLIRILSTYWLYDAESGTLFSSDWFGHTCLPASDMSCVIRSDTSDATTYDSARRHVLAKYWWLPHADTSPMVKFLMDLFDELDVRRIAPTHGCILEGRDVILRHRDLMVRLLKELGSKDIHQ
jgi:flavorubredoxin